MDESDIICHAGFSRPPLASTNKGEECRTYTTVPNVLVNLDRICPLFTCCA